MTQPIRAGTHPPGCVYGVPSLHPPWARRIGYGLIGTPPPGRISKCRCGALELPVEPTQPMIWPAATHDPTLTSGAKSARWA